ncbi:hypothetical protein JKP88DRAFT_306066 [Tribonema minus]|uniref:Uncharacterized protein n=1 Tax=Tribonema minus TaxID=303371 RepID=A0A835Z987_9STRA|nr:hypothetical protein JKP88DRAFT_306066 [Tribonema minus]
MIIEDSAVEAPPAAAPSRLAEPSAAVSPAMAQQDDNSSTGSCKGSPASAPEPFFDGTSEAQGCETPSSSAQGRPGMAARGPSSDPSVPQGQHNDPCGALALSSACGNPYHRDGSVSSGRGGEMVDLAQQVKSLLQPDIHEAIHRSLNPTAAAVGGLQESSEKFANYAAHVADVQESAYQQRREQQRRDTELSDARTSDLQALQTRLKEAERRAFEWADRATVADKRVAAADARAATLESRLVAEEARSANNFRTVMVYFNRLEAKVSSLLMDAAAVSQQHRQLPYTPGSAYHSAQQMLSAPRAELNEFNLRTFGGSAARRDDDERSRISMHSTRSLLRPTPAMLPPHPGSVNYPTTSSATATVRDASARPPVPTFSFSLALPLAKAPAREGDKGSLKDEARAQLDGAVRVAHSQQLWTLTQTQARMDATQQLAAERAEHDTKVAATEAALQREREILRMEREEVERSARANELLLRQTQLEGLAQERQLAANRTAMHAEQRAFDHAKSQLAFSAASRGGDGSESVHSSAPSRRRDRDGGGGGGGGGDGGDGDDGGGGGTPSSSERSGSGGRRGAPAAAPAPAAVWPGQPAGLPTEAWFDAQGRAITRMAIRLRADDLPRTCITGSSLAPLVNLRRMLPSLITEKANHKRQKPRDGTMWPALISSDDFGALWFSTTVFAVVNRVVNDGGDNYLVSSLSAQAAEWVSEGERLVLSDTARLEWLFARISQFLELKRPAELAADLVRWVVATGFPLQHFVHEFSTAAAEVISTDSRQDNFVLSALLEVCRQQYSATAAAWTYIADDPQSHTTRDLLEAYAHWSAPHTADGDSVYDSDGGSNHGSDDFNSDIDADYYSDYTHNSEAPSATASGAAAGVNEQQQQQQQLNAAAAPQQQLNAAAAPQQQPALSLPPHAGSELAPPFVPAPPPAPAQHLRLRRGARDEDPKTAGFPPATPYSAAALMLLEPAVPARSMPARRVNFKFAHSAGAGGTPNQGGVGAGSTASPAADAMAQEAHPFSALDAPTASPASLVASAAADAAHAPATASPPSAPPATAAAALTTSSAPTSSAPTSTTSATSAHSARVMDCSMAAPAPASFSARSARAAAYAAAAHPSAHCSRVATPRACLGPWPGGTRAGNLPRAQRMLSGPCRSSVCAGVPCDAHHALATCGIDLAMLAPSASSIAPIINSESAPSGVAASGFEHRRLLPATVATRELDALLQGGMQGMEQASFTASNTFCSGKGSKKAGVQWYYLSSGGSRSSQGSYNLAQRVAFWRRRTSLALQRALTRVVIDNWNAVIAPDGDVSAYRRIALLQVPRPSPASAEPPAPP